MALRRFGPGRCMCEPAGLVLGNKAVVENKVVAGRAPQAGRVPGIEVSASPTGRNTSRSSVRPAGVRRG